MEKKEVLFLFTDYWADWEVGHAMAQISFTDAYVVKTISIDKKPKVSVSGMRVEIDYSVQEYHCLNNLAMIVLVGSGSWRNNRFDEIAGFVRRANGCNIPVAAICGATVFLAKDGFLNCVKHTSNGLGFFKERLAGEDTYTGWKYFVSAQAVCDGGFITANETAALEFAREIALALLEDPDDVSFWYEKHRRGLIS
ncbi:MAG: DJ-1/PfpI family protein [Defluviitaleaceae bacterium]|nr:DJ-1/PfpI family protein [Defluviitaleaceae bacterium]